MAGKRAKRTPEDVAKMGEAVVAYVAKNPGVSVEQIKKALGVATKELQLPIVRMIAAKKLKTTGQKRGTKYFAAGGSGAATEPKRAAPTRKA